MQLTVNRAALSEALDAVAPALPSRSIRPILQNVRLAAEKNLLRLTATDLDLSISTAIPAEVATPGTALVDGAHITTLLRRMRGDSATLALGTMLRIESTDGQFELIVADGTDFPSMADIPDGGHTAESEALAAALRSVRHATATNEAMYSLAGILFDADNGAVVATDTHRVVVARLDLGGKGKSIIPAKTCDIIAGLCDRAKSVRVVQTANLLHAACGDTRLCAHLIEGHFPRWNEVIPQTTAWPCRMRVERAELLRVVELARLSAGVLTRAVRITLGAQCEVSGESPEKGKGAAALDALEVKGACVITVNGDYLMQAAKAARGETLEIFIKDANSPIVIEVAGADGVEVISPVYPKN